MPGVKKHVLKLTEAQRKELKQVIRGGVKPARMVTRAQALLATDRGMPDELVASVLSIGTDTVRRVRNRFAEEGLEAALTERPRPGGKRKLDDDQQAHLVATACSDAPEGSTHWTLRQLAKRAIELGFVESISLEAVRQMLNRHALKPWKTKEWCIAELTEEFIARMEALLDLYKEAYDPRRPVVCFDETSRQLTEDVREPIPAAPGRTKRTDSEYRRRGTRNLFMMVEPKAGLRHVAVTARRTAIDFAHQMKWLVDEGYPDAIVIRVVLDNLNTHSVRSLYKAFEPEEARRIASRLQFYYTPRHGSWLNMAEIELSVLSRLCLNRRIGTEPTLKREIAAVVHDRNEARATINWRFTKQDARRKFRYVYAATGSG